MRWFAFIAVLCATRVARADGVCAQARAALDEHRWAEAEVLVDECVQPDAAAWVAEARAVLAAKAPDLTTLEIEAVPANAEVTIAGFASGVRFHPRTLHVPTGTYVVTLSAPGYQAEQRTLAIVDRMPIRLAVTLRSVLPPPPPPRPTSLGPWLVMGAGAAIVLTGVAYHVLELEPERAALADAVDATHDPDLAAYAEHSDRFDERRRNTLLIYSVGIVTLVSGTVWRFLDYRQQRTEISAVPIRGGAVVGVQWHL